MEREERKNQPSNIIHAVVVVVVEGSLVVCDQHERAGQLGLFMVFRFDSIRFVSFIVYRSSMRWHVCLF